MLSARSIAAIGGRRFGAAAAAAAAAAGASYVASCSPAPAKLASAAAASHAMVSSAAEEKLAAWKQTMNAVYANPFKTIFGVAAPLYGLIFYRESTHPATADLLLSQRLIHTRVYGQAIAVATTISVMSLVTMMDRRGGAFLTPQEQAHSGSLTREYSTSAENYGRPKRSEAEKLGLVPHNDDYGVHWDVLVPLALVPSIPLMFLLLRNRVQKETLHRLVMGAVGLGLLHAGYIQLQDSTMYNS